MKTRRRPKHIIAECPCHASAKLSYVAASPKVGIYQAYWTGECTYGHVVQRMAQKETP